MAKPDKKLRKIVTGAVLGVFAVCATAAPSIAADKKGAMTGLKLPRFVSLRSSEVNLRTGPGRRYPVEWVLTYRHMPVEVVDEFEAWRKVRDWQGSLGWVHRSLLSGERWVIVKSAQATVRRGPKANTPIIARADKKVLGKLNRCRATWCEADFSGYEGWFKRAEVWGVYADEIVK